LTSRLAGSDPADIEVGTRGYRDPFLEERKPPRWDGQAERYAAAVTLHEMATGTRPKWGDGSTDPALTKLDGPEIDETLLDPAVRSELAAFFAKGLHRRPEERFHTAGEMRDAWARVFRGTDADQGALDEGVSPADLDLSGITPASSLLELPISARLRNALERLEVVTAADLLAIPAGDLVRTSGVGALTRADVNHLAKRLRETLAEEAPSVGTGGGSIDRIADQLVPQPPADEDHRTVVRTLFGLIEADVPPWPSQRDVTTHSGLSSEVVAGALGSARTRWRKTPTVTAVRREITELLAARGGIAGADELAALLLSSRGSVASEPKRSQLARAVVRAAVETEGTLAAPSFVVRRVEDALLVALDGEVTVGDEANTWDADSLAEAAARLAEVASDLAEREPLPTRDEVVGAVREVELPDSLPPFADARLVRLAAAAASRVSVSPQLVLYPTGMPPRRAIEETRPVLLTRRGLKVDEVRERVMARFPEAAPLPGPPELNDLLEPLGFEWDRSAQLYRLPQRGGVVGTLTTAYSTVTGSVATEERELGLRELDRQLGVLRDSPAASWRSASTAPSRPGASR
jgi:hypothetical protein